jgi:hypothetical protein
MRPVSASCSSRPPETCLTTGRGGRSDLDEAEVLFGGEALAGFGVKAGAAMASTKSLAISAAARVDLAIDADDAAEGRDGIGGEGFLIGLEDGCAGGRAAGVGVLDDDDGWARRKLLRQLPAGVEVDEVVEAEFLALELARRRCRGRSRRRRERRAGGGFRRSAGIGPGAVDAEGCGQAGRRLRCGRRLRRADRARGFGNLSRVLAMAVS